MYKYPLSLFLLLYSISTHAADMAFGRIEYVPGSGALNAIIDPANGALSCNNPSEYTCPTFATRGSYLITGTTGTQVDIRCEKSAAISNNTITLELKDMKIHIAGTTADCNVLNKTVHTHTITGNQASDTLYNSGRLRILNNPGDLWGNYSTSNTGGVPHTIRLIFI